MPILHVQHIATPYEETTLKSLVYLFYNTLKDDFIRVEGNLGGLPNQSHSKLSAEIIWCLNV